jgi:hypothetical protein
MHTQVQGSVPVAAFSFRQSEVHAAAGGDGLDGLLALACKPTHVYVRSITAVCLSIGLSLTCQAAATGEVQFL